jgi:hypothetical protein
MKRSEPVTSGEIAGFIPLAEFVTVLGLREFPRGGGVQKAVDPNFRTNGIQDLE